MGELTNLDGMGDIGVNLTNKLANAVGWIANKETPKKKAINTYIKEIQEKDYDPITKAALISKAKQTIKEYCNQNDILNIAIQSLQHSAKPEEIEDDWLVQFMNKAKFVSSSEFQLIWGKILARECNKPGSIPRILLYTLEKMDKEDAQAFTNLCRLSVHSDESCDPVIIGARFSEYKKYGVVFDNLINLNSLGLIEMSFGAFATEYAISAEKLPAKINYFDEEYELLENREIRVGNVIFTKSGQALCKSIEVEKIEGFWETYCLPLWEGRI